MGNFYTKAAASFKRSAFDVKTLIFQRGVRRVAADIQALEQASPVELKRVQNQLSAGIALYAFKNTEFYEDFYRSHGFDEEDLRDSGSFVDLPQISKSHVREHNEQLMVRSAPPSRFLRSNTGGSTGEPLSLYHDKLAPTAAMWWTAYRWAGTLPSTDVGFLQRERRNSRQQIAESAQWWPTKRVFLDSRIMTESSMRNFIASFSRNPDFIIIGYVGAVAELAEYLHGSGATLPGLRSVSVTAAPLDASVRRRLEEIFGVPILNQYRSAEIPWIAAQCESGPGLHVLASHRRVDVVGEHGAPVPAGTPGKLVLTDFANKVFPLVKYSIGDTSSLQRAACACGRSFPILQPIEGRITDTLRLPDGRAITGGMTGLFNKYPQAVKQFQIVQIADGSIVLRCVPANDGSLPYIANAQSELKALTSGLVDVSVELVDAIAHDRGKSRIVQSEMPRS